MSKMIIPAVMTRIMMQKMMMMIFMFLLWNILVLPLSWLLSSPYEWMKRDNEWMLYLDLLKVQMNEDEEAEYYHLCHDQRIMMRRSLMRFE